MTLITTYVSRTIHGSMFLAETYTTQFMVGDKCESLIDGLLLKNTACILGMHRVAQ